MKLLKQARYALILLKELHRRLDKLEQAIGNIQLALNQRNLANSISEHEFQVYSQSGEDGIIQFLISKIPSLIPIFIEFGVERYTESNTRFLLTHDDWSGLVIDGSADNINFIQQDRVYWQHSLTAIHAFVNKDNINQLIVNNGFVGTIGLLSVDIDGNDYWVWQAIDCIEPVIVICEYNSLFGPIRKVTIPYDKNFIRNKAHYSCVYYGASLAALVDLAHKKGYVFIGSNKRGNNAFFVKSTYADAFQAVTTEQAYVRSRFRESRDVSGNLNFLNFDQALKEVKDLPLYDIETDQIIRVRDL